ncbi:hypothetical protein [Streptomyces phaeochromogenes]
MNQSQPDRYNVRTRNVTGQVVVGRDNTVTTSSVDTPVDLSELLRFAEAVIQAFPALALTANQQQVVQTIAAEIQQAANQVEPNHGRLRQLGQSLRTVLEGGAAGALSSGLLSLWSP